ncbi:MAG: ABC transporter permease [Acidobacteria bacterium]|nr:ABC transporter permease [Acidobacteriota bacterium]
MKILREILSPLIAVLAAFFVGGIIVVLIKDNPFETYWLLLANSFGSVKDIGWTLFYATPLIFTGLAVAVAFRCGLFNIGAEGQLYTASFMTAWVAIKFGGTIVEVGGKPENWSWASLPAFLLVPLCVLTAVVVGGLWGAIPGFLRARFGSSEVINTIMLNFIGIALVSYLTQYHYKVPGDPILESAPIGKAAYIPQLHEYFSFIPKDVPLNFSFLIAILMCVLVYVFLWKTKWGYELRAVGANSAAAEYGGISPRKQIIVAMTFSGALAGMVALNEVLGSRHLYYDGFSAELGFLGIAVALLGRNHPLGVFIAALFFGVLMRGEIFVDAFTRYVSKDIAQVLQAIVILFVACLQKYSKK